MKKLSLLFISALLGFSVFASELQNVSHGTVYLRNRGADNWFMQLGGGTNMYFNHRENDFGTDFMDRLGWQGQLAIGRWNSPNWGARAVLEAGQLNSFSPGTWGAMNGGDGQQFVGGQIHLMYNLMNAWGTYRPNRVYSLIPFGGIGYMYGLQDWDKPHDGGWFRGQNQALTFNAGLINQFMFSPRFGMFVELAARIVPGHFDGAEAGRSVNSILTASAGIQFGLGGKQTFTPAELMDYSVINDLNSQINRLRADNEGLRAQLPCPVCPPAPAPERVVETAVSVPNVVFFRLNSAVIDAAQRPSVENIALALRNNPNATVQITGHACSIGGDSAHNMRLSERRAEAVRDALIAAGIASNRITTRGVSMRQPYFTGANQDSWNRVAIAIIQ